MALNRRAVVQNSHALVHRPSNTRLNLTLAVVLELTRIRSKVQEGATSGTPYSQIDLTISGFLQDGYRYPGILTE